MADNGGGLLTNCIPASLQVGLSVHASQDVITIEPTGTPLNYKSETLYGITASNAPGSDGSQVYIRITPAAQSFKNISL